MCNEAKQKKLSLKRGLLIIMTLCWVIPIGVILIYSWYSISHNVQGRIEDTIVTSVDTAFQQTLASYEDAMDASRAVSYDDAIENAYRVYHENHDDVLLYDTVMSYLSDQYGYDNHFKAVFLFFTKQPDNLYYTTNRTSSKEYFNLQSYQKNVHATVQKAYKGLGTQIGFMNADGRLYMIRNIVDSSFKPYAVLAMECDQTSLHNSLQNIVWLGQAQIRLDGMALTSANGNLDFRNSDGVWYDKATGNYTIQKTDTISGHIIQLCVTSNSSELVDELPNLIKALPYIVILTVALWIFVLWAYYHYVSHPMDKLTQAAARMEAGERGFVINETPHSREFQYLTERFNSMSSQLAVQFERIYEEQKAVQDARVMALRSQINPHFLNNTLEGILWAARMANDQRVCRMIEALSTMLNAAMVRDGSARGTVAQEITYVDAYLYIISERLGDRLTIIKMIDDNTLNALVPCLILQPIVENAIEHGIAHVAQGALVLKASIVDQNLILEVENDGTLDKKSRKRIEELLAYPQSDIEKSNCIGIKNVNRRLKILYGEAGGLTIKEVTPGRILSRIVIPNVDFGPKTGNEKQ